MDSTSELQYVEIKRLFTIHCFKMPLNICFSVKYFPHRKNKSEIVKFEAIPPTLK